MSNSHTPTIIAVMRNLNIPWNVEIYVSELVGQVKKFKDAHSIAGKRYSSTLRSQLVWLFQDHSLQPNSAPKFKKRAHDHIKFNQKWFHIFSWNHNNYLKIGCDNVLVESSSKTKAPKATTYYHYSFFMVHFLSCCHRNVSILAKRHQRRSREASWLCWSNRIWPKKYQGFYFHLHSNLTLLLTTREIFCIINKCRT